MTSAGSWTRLPQQIADELLQCGVCYNQYTSRSNECQPKLLPCSHGFCLACIDACARQRRHFTCPVCRRQTRLAGGAAGLPNNYTVLSLLDIIEKCATDAARPPPFNPAAAAWPAHPPVPPPRRVFNQGYSSFRLVQRYGHYSDDKLQTGHFCAPRGCAVSGDGRLTAVVDSVQMSVQLWCAQGYVSMFSLLGAQCVCFASATRLLVGSHRGVQLCSLNGDLLGRDTLVGSVVAVTPYKFGFVACTASSVHLYRSNLKYFKRIARARRRNIFKRGAVFLRISAVAVTMHAEIVVLDAGAGKIYLLDDDGYMKMCITPGNQSCGTLLNPEGLATDKCNAIFVSDTGNQRVLKFSADGYFSKCVLNVALEHPSAGQCWPYGLAATNNKLVVVLAGKQFAEVRHYRM